jgi:hypothetical protein
MEPEGSLPCSQGPSTGPYPEPDQSSPCHPTLSKITDTFRLSKVRAPPQIKIPLHKVRSCRMLAVSRHVSRAKPLADFD